ncbi:MAG: sugar phosphate isomerase/epimerase [Clostridiales bacterium]|nr:sugar phosphate isomerase/epimerase [Clostridiales bacterium]
MKLGGSVVGSWKTSEDWAKLLTSTGFAAIPCPVNSNTDQALAKEVIAATREAGVVIAEVGVWKNVLSPDTNEQKDALHYAKAQLALAEEYGIPCCVNIAGAPGARWDGAYKANYTQETYELIINTVRDIIDSVKPKTAFYTLEPMPWMLPDGPDEYLQMIADINRPQFAVHMDFVNMINSPRRFLYAHEFIEECLQKLGKHIKSTHLKDSLMKPDFTAVIHETAPGLGQLDFAQVLDSINRHLPHDAPVLLEHMNTFEEYDQAFRHMRAIAKAAGIPHA